MLSSPWMWWRAVEGRCRAWRPCGARRQSWSPSGYERSPQRSGGWWSCPRWSCCSCGTAGRGQKAELRRGHRRAKEVTLFVTKISSRAVTLHMFCSAGLWHYICFVQQGCDITYVLFSRAVTLYMFCSNTFCYQNKQQGLQGCDIT